LRRPSDVRNAQVPLVVLREYTKLSHETHTKKARRAVPGRYTNGRLT
jgi:hypothetical protein